MFPEKIPDGRQRKESGCSPMASGGSLHLMFGRPESYPHTDKGRRVGKGKRSGNFLEEKDDVAIIGRQW